MPTPQYPGSPVASSRTISGKELQQRPDHRNHQQDKHGRPRSVPKAIDTSTEAALDGVSLVTVVSAPQRRRTPNRRRQMPRDGRACVLYTGADEVGCTARRVVATTRPTLGNSRVGSVEALRDRRGGKAQDAVGVAWLSTALCGAPALLHAAEIPVPATRHEARAPIDDEQHFFRPRAARSTAQYRRCTRLGGQCATLTT